MYRELASITHPPLKIIGKADAGTIRVPARLGFLRRKNMEIPLEKHYMQSLSSPTRKLLEKDNPSLGKNERSCFYPSSLCEHCKESQLEGKLSTETNSLASQAPSSSEPINLSDKDVQDLTASLSEVQISKQSAKCSDEKVEYEKKFSWDPRTSCKTARVSNFTFDVSGKQINGVEHAGAYDVSNKLIRDGSVIRTKERKLFNMVVDEHVSLAGASSTTRLLNILNSFPRRVPVSRPRKKLLILDINGILADVVYPPPKGYKADIRISGRAVFTRPHCRDFLKFCLERFQVGIWSSRSKKLVDRILDYLIGDLRERLTFCWDISQCTESQFRTLENRHKVMVFKELRMLWEKRDSSLPWRNGDYSELNTLLLDDSPYKALLNPVRSGITASRGPNGKIRAYLEEVAMAENVQEYIENHPFGQCAITERSMSWEFYNKVLQRQYAASMAARH
ncbi:hypothetical protein V2J09_022253 [Rumex salicifolius]